MRGLNWSFAETSQQERAQSWKASLAFLSLDKTDFARDFPPKSFYVMPVGRKLPSKLLPPFGLMGPGRRRNWKRFRVIARMSKTEGPATEVTGPMRQ